MEGGRRGGEETTWANCQVFCDRSVLFDRMDSDLRFITRCSSTALLAPPLEEKLKVALSRGTSVRTLTSEKPNSIVLSSIRYRPSESPPPPPPPCPDQSSVSAPGWLFVLFLLLFPLSPSTSWRRAQKLHGPPGSRSSSHLCGVSAGPVAA